MTETFEDVINDKPVLDAGKFVAPYIYHSLQIDKLLTALSKAQGAFTSVAKDDKNYFDKSYSTIASVMHTVRKPLADNGLSITQHIVNEHLITFLGHASGQYMQSAKKIIFKDISNAQAEGSGISYARRYALMSVLGLASEDDDGNKASGKISIGDAMEKLHEARHLSHLQNIWKKHEPEWRNLFVKEKMQQLVEVKNNLKAKFEIEKDLANDKNEENKFTEESEKKAKELTDQVLNEFKGSKIVDTADDQVASV